MRAAGDGIPVAQEHRVLTEQAPVQTLPMPMQVRVVGPESAGLTPTDLRRLFRGRRLTPARRDRLAASGRVTATCANRVVGVAAYERVDLELRVHEFGVDASSPAAVEPVASALLDALEVACLAGGGRRLVLLPRAAISAAMLRDRGFVNIAEGCAGSWYEKIFPS
jgi:hypothetical protein